MTTSYPKSAGSASPHKTMPAEWRVGWIRPFGPPVEDPIRIRQFIQQAIALKWDASSRRDGLTGLYGAISQLVEAELRYYFKRRSGSRVIAAWCKRIGFVASAIGVMSPAVLPLLVKLKVPLVDQLPPVETGYVSFALAGLILLADKVFAGSDAHHRYTATQLQLEQLFTVFTVKWHRLLSALDSGTLSAAVGSQPTAATSPATPSTPSQSSIPGETTAEACAPSPAPSSDLKPATACRSELDPFFELAEQFAKDLHTAMSDETAKWRAESLEAIKAMRQAREDVEKQTKTASTP